MQIFRYNSSTWATKAINVEKSLFGTYLSIFFFDHSSVGLLDPPDAPLSPSPLLPLSSSFNHPDHTHANAEELQQIHPVPMMQIDQGRRWRDGRRAMRWTDRWPHWYLPRAPLSLPPHPQPLALLVCFPFSSHLMPFRFLSPLNRSLDSHLTCLSHLSTPRLGFVSKIILLSRLLHQKIEPRSSSRLLWP